MRCRCFIGLTRRASGGFIYHEMAFMLHVAIQDGSFSFASLTPQRCSHCIRKTPGSFFLRVFYVV